VRIASLCPEPIVRTDVDPKAQYIEVDARARAIIIAYDAAQPPPTFIALPVLADKDLSSLKRLSFTELQIGLSSPASGNRSRMNILFHISFTGR
jgi:hypothetical protein